MKSRQLIKYFQVFLCFCISVFVFGCGQDVSEEKETYLDKINIGYADNSAPDNEIWPDAELEERFAEYWYKRFAGEIDELWLMETPHFQFMADLKKYRNYLARAAAQLPIDIEIKDIKRVSEYKYLVSCRMTFTRSGKQHSVALGDRWVFVDNQWFHILYDPLVFPFTDS